jgi:hypothetical protein
MPRSLKNSGRSGARITAFCSSGKRSVVRAQLLQHHGQLVQHVGIVGLQLQCADVGLGGLLHLPRRHQRAAMQDELLHWCRAVDQRHDLLDAPVQVFRIDQPCRLAVRLQRGAQLAQLLLGQAHLGQHGGLLRPVAVFVWRATPTPRCA